MTLQRRKLVPDVKIVADRSSPTITTASTKATLTLTDDELSVISMALLHEFRTLHKIIEAIETDTTGIMGLINGLDMGRPEFLRQQIVLIESVIAKMPDIEQEFWSASMAGEDSSPEIDGLQAALDSLRKATRP